MRGLILAAMLVLAAAPAEAVAWSCRFLNFHRGPAPRVLHVEMWCQDADAVPEDACYGGLRVWKVFRFAPGSTRAEQQAAMRAEARRSLRVLVKDLCVVTANHARDASLAEDDAP